MSQPGVLLSFLISGAVASLWSVLFAEKRSHFVFYLISGIGGFFGGVKIGDLIGQSLLRIGEVNLVFGLLGAFGVLWFCRLVIQSAS